MRLYDTLGGIIENGDSLQPNKIYAQNCCPAGIPNTQGSLILPKGSNGFYYVFSPTITDSTYNYLIVNPQLGKFPYDLLQYHIVNMNANGGLGKVVQKNIPLLTNRELARVGMMACRHANGYDWWLLKQGFDTNLIYTFLVTKDNVDLIFTQGFSEPKFGLYDAWGQSCFSTDGEKYAFATGGVNSQGDKLFIADFDRCTGLLSNPKSVHSPLHSSNTILDTIYPGEKDTAITGLAFSPNDNFLYISKGFNLYQYELNEPDSILAWYHVQHGPDTIYQWSVNYYQLQKGIDKRIYIGKRDASGKQNSVINFPDLKGSACGFCKKCLRNEIGLDVSTSLANMPDFNLGPLLPCWPLENSQLAVGSKQLEVYPNPGSTIFYIKNAQGKKKEMYSSIGQLILASTKDEIDVRRLSKGVYYLRCGYQTKKVIIE
ncbi:MAG: T9SS type A sorting domain-containing protein [Bacteroidetes bacterium]|nr:T9SS type A sorting domain-containing protein [Bacteroidota bacterium]